MVIQQGHYDIQLPYLKCSHLNVSNIGATRVEVSSKNKSGGKGSVCVCVDRNNAGKQKMEREREREQLDWRTITLLDEQEGRLIYMRAASSASSSLYSNGDLGGAGDSE